MTAQRLVPDPPLRARDPRAHQAARHLHVPGLRGRAAAAAARLRAARARALPAVRRRPDDASRAGRSTPWRCCCSARSACWSRTRIAAPAARAAAEPAGHSPPSAADLAFNTAASFTTNTNWQAYSRRVDDELPHPDGRARLAQLHVGRGRHRRRARAGARPHAPAARPTSRRRIGNFWVDLIRAHRSTCCCPSASSCALVARLAGRDPELRAVRRGDHARGREADARDGPGGLAGGRSSSSAPTAAASSTPTARTRSRTRRRSPTSSQMLLDLRHPGGAHLHLRPHGARPAQGWALFAAMAVLFLVGVTVAYYAEAARQPGAAQRTRRRPGGRQHGRQGGALRHRQLGALRDRHHGRLVRRGELDARQLHAARRPGAAREHRARRGDLRRRRRRPLRHARLRRCSRSSSPG